jgi:WhiB family redox-sensing transcriptional regulator
MEIEVPDWDLAKCRNRDTNIWYPEKKDTEGYIYGKSLCRGLVDGKPCPILWECGTWAVETEEPWGIWGGLDEKERESIRSGAKWQEEILSSRPVR